MQFQRVEPHEKLKHLVECYWIAEGPTKTPQIQKIIPDGFPEIIFHFADPYRIKLSGTWEEQSKTLIAGQITKFFFLENTGASSIFGIKLKPSALTVLFDVDMILLKDKVIDIPYLNNKELNELSRLLRKSDNQDQRATIVNGYLMSMVDITKSIPPIETVIENIFATNGVVSIAELCELSGMHERKLERVFKKYVGLPPKFFSRVIRFSNIFKIAQLKKLRWTEVGLESGFYDQAHFIKDFKSFTGDDPTQYFFDEPSLGNFFMKKN